MDRNESPEVDLLVLRVFELNMQLGLFGATQNAFYNGLQRNNLIGILKNCYVESKLTSTRFTSINSGRSPLFKLFTKDLAGVFGSQKGRFSWRKLEERALSLRGERVELEREKSLGEGVWRGFHMVAPASSHRSTSKSRFVLREVLKKKTALVSKVQVLCLLLEEEKGVRYSASPDLASESSDQELDNESPLFKLFTKDLAGVFGSQKGHFSWRKLEERALSLRGERVELEREKSLGEGVWRGFHTVAPASLHRSTSKSRFVLREVLKKKTALVSKVQVLCLLLEEEKGVSFLGPSEAEIQKFLQISFIRKKIVGNLEEGSWPEEKLKFCKEKLVN
ncbi:hypothetical protein M5K25_017905 [Dendrobium thyrsiflorum]|uniref:Uncharacterized protein n=1 Tax=Dendrobium thyrsiflorum TaxID=117978 RepID=A0ABD0UGL4_DENTH